MHLCDKCQKTCEKDDLLRYGFDCSYDLCNECRRYWYDASDNALEEFVTEKK